MCDSRGLSLSIVRTESRLVRPISDMPMQLVEDVEQAPTWAKYLIAFQQKSEKRLEDLECTIKKNASGKQSQDDNQFIKSFMKSRLILSWVFSERWWMLQNS